MRCIAGDTLGGIGSAIALQRNSFKKQKDGSFTGMAVWRDLQWELNLAQELWSCNLTEVSMCKLWVERS